MYVRCNPNKNNVKYLSYVECYRDENDVSRQKTIKKIGDWDELKKLYKDPIEHFNRLAKQEEEKFDGYYSIVTSETNMSDIELNRKSKKSQQLKNELVLILQGLTHFCCQT